MIVALIALFVALGGSSYAALKISAGNIKSGAVGSRAIADNSVRSQEIRNATIRGGDVRDDTLTNADIDNTQLQAATAKAATSADNANVLDGLNSTAFARRACGLKNGAIHGYARIIAGAGFSTGYTTADIESPYNCSGQPVEARRIGTGFYEIRFNGNPGGGIAVATSMQAPSMSPSNRNVSLSRTNAGTFVAAIESSPGVLIDWPFVIVLL